MFICSKKKTDFFFFGGMILSRLSTNPRTIVFKMKIERKYNKIKNKQSFYYSRIMLPAKMFFFWSFLPKRSLEVVLCHNFRFIRVIFKAKKRKREDGKKNANKQNLMNLFHLLVTFRLQSNKDGLTNNPPKEAEQTPSDSSKTSTLQTSQNLPTSTTASPNNKYFFDLFSPSWNLFSFNTF